MKRVFVSHASKDKEIADAFVDIILHGAMSIDLGEIFCTSTEGTKIKSGEIWRDAIKSSLVEAKVTLLIITPNYKESEVCLNEMGAAWVLSSLVLATIVEPITFRTVGVIPEVSQVKKLLDDIHLDDLRDDIQNALEIPSGKIASARWTQKKKEFIKKVNKYIEETPFPLAMDRKVYDELFTEKDDLNKTIDNLIEEKDQLGKQIKDLEKAKDAKEVKAIKKKFDPSTEYEEFIELCKRVTVSLRPLTSILRGIVYKTYSSKSLKFDWHGYKAEIEEADAEDFINIDEDNGTIEADWHTTKKMQAIYKALNELSNFIETPPSSDFDEEFEEQFSSPFKLDNKSFWDEAFKLPININ